MSQGFTHVFEFIFASEEDCAAYLAHPAQVAATKEFVNLFEDGILIDYKPIIYR